MVGGGNPLEPRRIHGFPADRVITPTWSPHTGAPGAAGAMTLANDRGDPSPGSGSTHVLRDRISDIDAGLERATCNGARILEADSPVEHPPHRQRPLRPSVDP